MKTLTRALFGFGILVTASSAFAEAGGISAGGPLTITNDVVCWANDGSYTAAVAIGDSSGNHVITIGVGDTSENAVDPFESNSEETLELNSFLKYVGDEGSVEVTQTRAAQNGGSNYVGTFSFTLKGEIISKDANCHVFVPAGI